MAFGGAVWPRSVREASTLFSFGHAGAYDHEDDAIYLPGSVRMIDMGDADIVHTDTMKSHANIEAGVRRIGRWCAARHDWRRSFDQYPCINAFDDQGDIHILQIDAHLDFVDERHGVRYGHGTPCGVQQKNPMSRA